MELHLENLPKSLELVDDERGLALSYIDERKLPASLVIERAQTWQEVVDAIKTLAIRGAPAIGIAGAAALALWAARAERLSEIAEVAEAVASARPTAVNLRWGVNRALDAVQAVFGAPQGKVDQSAGAMAAYREAFARIERALVALVCDMQREDERVNRAIGAHGASLLGPNTRVLTHCNAGSLATYYYGTALGVVYAAAEQGKIERVFADETRPVGQGARLTAWELARAGVPVTLICDNMAASLMAQGKVDAVVVGADRIARNGDAANKIGTYGVAVLAHEHGVPFYVAAPTSTIDASFPDGSGIVIEQRAPSEVLPTPIEGVEVWNPAFDVTPARLITRIITENGAFLPEELASRL